jgi:DNA-binding MarR family transcriptional regulator
MRERRRLSTGIKRALRDLSNQIALLNHQVSAKVRLKDVDLDCLDLIAQHGPLTPSAIAQRAGLHPATMTGILDRLETNGWISRDRAATDRRAVLVSARPDRVGELFELYSGMDGSMDDVLANYSEEQLELIADFLQRSTVAGGSAAATLAGEPKPDA